MIKEKPINHGQAGEINTPLEINNPSEGKIQSKKNKERLDVLLVERGYFSGREKAKAAIMAGEILVDGIVSDKAGNQIPLKASIEVKSSKLPFVSRGGLKLAKAIEGFNLSFQGKIVLDIGSSTGGFVDCALQNGADMVYAVDVGYGQLAWKLRQDSRVVVWEKTNARYLTEEHIPQRVDWITVDASFISLSKVLAAAVNFLKDEGQVLALVKPQFEAGRENVGKKGVVRDKKVHYQVLENVVEAFVQLNLYPYGLDFSPITGPEGNIEYLLWAGHEKKENQNLMKVIDEAWNFHNQKQ